MGSANTPENVMKYYHRLSLSKCSLNLIEIPKQCTSNVFSDIYEYCVKQEGIIPIAIYKRHTDEQSGSAQKFTGNDGQANKDSAGGVKQDDTKTPKKSYVWLHPPKKIVLNLYDELFVLCEKSEKENVQEQKKANNEANSQSVGGKSNKTEGKKIQNEIMKEMNKLNGSLKDLLYSSKELAINVEKSGQLLQSDLGYKIRSELEHF